MTDAAANQMSLNPLALCIDGVSLSYGDNKVLDRIDLDIRPGEFFALLGPSGCGKTTLLRSIAGFAQASSGNITVGGKDILQLPPWKRDVGMVFQSYALWPHMSVARNVAFGLEERRMAKADIARRVEKALHFVDLSELANRRPSQLSGGQQQRVALARTIAIEPKILLLDEPLSNLDAKLRVEVRRELRNLQQRLGLTTVLVTHDQEEANTICDRVAVMSAGKVQQVGTPAELYERPANLFVANFLGTANVIEGRVSSHNGSRVFESNGGLRLPIANDRTIPAGARMVFRPQDVSIVASGGNITDAIDAEVTYREFLGSTIRYIVRAADTDISIDAPFKTGDPIYDTGAAVKIAVSAGAMKWLSS